MKATGDVDRQMVRKWGGAVLWDGVKIYDPGFMLTGLILINRLINVVAVCLARLVLGRVTVCGRVNHLGM